VVSNRGVRRTILNLVLLLLSFGARAQRPPADKTQADAIQRVKSLPISSLERNLPKVTLEFFLSYEGGGAPIQWRVNDCREHVPDKTTDQGRESATCVQADIDLKDGRAVNVMVSVGTLDGGPVGVPTIYGVRVTDRIGTIHRLDRLSDLPVELHRPLPKGPRDFPRPVSAEVLIAGSSTSCGP
jgi:hypothetical protein